MELLEYERDFNLTTNFNEWLNGFKSRWLQAHTVVELQETTEKKQLAKEWNFLTFSTVLESRAFMSLSVEMVLEQNFKYFMLGPIGLRLGDTVTAKTYKFDSLSEAELYMAQLDKDKTVLYDFHIETNGSSFIRIAGF